MNYDRATGHSQEKPLIGDVLDRIYSGAGVTQSEEAMSVYEVYRLLVKKIEEQHEMTRKTVREESKQLRADILQSVKANPIATVDLISKLLLVSSVFALAVHVVSGFTIINPWFSMLMFAISVAGIGMAKIRRRTFD